MGQNTFKNLLPRLYYLSTKHYATINAFCNIGATEGHCSWSFFFRHPFLKEIVSNLLLLPILDNTHLSLQFDRRIWNHNPSKLFSCASFYSFLMLSTKNSPTFPWIRSFGRPRIPTNLELSLG